MTKPCSARDNTVTLVSAGGRGCDTRAMEHADDEYELDLDEQVAVDDEDDGALGDDDLDD
jgi:hypothetical protein